MRKVACAIVFVLLAACGSGGGRRRTSALVPPDTVVEPYAPLAIYGTRTVGGTPTTGALDAGALKNALYSICWSQVEAALADFCPNTGPLDDNGCLGHQCLMQVHMCVGNKYMEIAEETNELSFSTLLLTGSDPYTLPLGGSSVTYDIPPQSAVNRTLAFDLAVTAFSKGGERAVSAISSTTPNCFTTTGGINATVTENDIKKNRARVFATTYADTIQALVEATHRFTGNSLQVAGVQRQRVRDFGEAGQWLWNGRVNSVRAVAAAMGNDDDGSAVDIALPTCIPSLQNKASMQAALALQRRVALAETLGSTTTENFITSIRNALHTANPELEFGGMTNDVFLERFGLSRADIADGRQYLQEEHDTFQRTEVETFPGSGRIAGIATEPRVLPAAAAIAKTTGRRLQTTSTVSQTSYRASGVLQMLDYLRWGVRRAFRVSALPSVIQPAFRAAQAIAEAETGTHRVSVVSNGATSVKVNVHGVSSSEKFVVVNGLDGARCLSEGTIEGAPCDPADYILDSTGTFAGGDPGYVHELSNTLTYHVATTGVETLYLLSADGKWNALAGLDPGGIPGTSNAILTPIGGGMTRELALALAPQPQECGETQQDCVGLPADLVVPLESELTENNDPYENSWLHYLDLAEQMALEADALGEELIEAGLAGDLRAEAARDELESLCGGVQNVGSNCDDQAPRDESLETCLSNGTENAKLDWVTLGSVGLCVPSGNSDQDCSNCPVPVNETCTEGYVFVQPLGLIEDVPPAEGAHCEQLAALVEPDAVQGSARHDQIRVLLQGSTRWADRQVLASLMDQTTYDEDEFNHLEVSLGGSTIVSLKGNSHFPCDSNWANADQRFALRKVSGALFDQQCDLTDEQRATYITAFRRAYGTLRLITGGMAGAMNRSWISPGINCNDQDEGSPTFNDCAAVSSSIFDRNMQCDEVGTCLCRNDSPNPPWHYGNVPCAQGARHDLVVRGGADEVSGSDWVHMWSSDADIDCTWDRDEDPMLEAVLCETPTNREFGYDWDDHNFWLGQVPSVGQPDDLVAPVEPDELDPYSDAGTITSTDVYSALALGCYMRWSGDGECPDFDPAAPPDVPEITSAGDLKQIEHRIECAAHAVRNRAGRVLLANVPGRIVDTLESGDIQGLYPQFRGEHLEAMIAIQDDLDQLAAHVVNLETQLRVAKAQTGHARGELAGIQLQGEIQELQTLSRMLALASDAAAGTVASLGSTMAMAVPQFVLAEEIDLLEQRVQQANVGGVLTDYSTQVATVLGAIHQIGLDLGETVHRFNADLGRLESIESRADSAAASVCFLEEDEQNGRLFPVTSVIRRRYDTLRIRYERARDRARQMAFIARRAIEQRFGLILSQMNEDMTLVEAPATWVRDVCEFEGIDYDRIREAQPEDAQVPANYADGYLGDYVEKLRCSSRAIPSTSPSRTGRTSP